MHGVLLIEQVVDQDCLKVLQNEAAAKNEKEPSSPDFEDTETYDSSCNNHLNRHKPE